MGRIIIGLIVMAVGYVIAWKSEVIFNNVGTMEFFEKYMATMGGSRLGYKLIGILICFIGILVATNLFSIFMLWILGPLIRAQQNAR